MRMPKNIQRREFYIEIPVLYYIIIIIIVVAVVVVVHGIVVIVVAASYLVAGLKSKCVVLT